jgi:rare lipoprotein A
MAAVIAAACGPREAAVEDAAGIEPLDDEQIAQLREQFPRLRDTLPLPEPQPSGDAHGAPPTAMSPNGEVLRAVMGQATFYADRFEGRRTASGIPFRQNQLVAAHRSFPFGTILRVTNTRNDRSVNVRVVDRGPFSGQQTIIDLSRRTAQELGYIQAGRAPVRVEVLEWGRGVGAA